MKTTEELLNEMKDSYDYNDYVEKNKDAFFGDYMKLGRALNIKISEKKLKKSEVIARSGIETHYAYQILSDTKLPGRDKVIMFCYGMGLSVEETQNLLRITGYNQLYSKEGRDNVILFGLVRGMSVIEVNVLLSDRGFTILL